MKYRENSAHVAYHVIKIRNGYKVFTPKLRSKGTYKTKKEAYDVIEILNLSDRLPIVEHNAIGEIGAIKYPRRIKAIGSKEIRNSVIRKK